MAHKTQRIGLPPEVKREYAKRKHVPKHGAESAPRETGDRRKPVRQHEIAENLNAIGPAACPYVAIRIADGRQIDEQGLKNGAWREPQPIFLEPRQHWTRHAEGFGRLNPYDQQDYGGQRPQHQRAPKPLGYELARATLVEAAHLDRVKHTRACTDQHGQKRDAIRHRLHQADGRKAVLAYHMPADDARRDARNELRNHRKGCGGQKPQKLVERERHQAFRAYRISCLRRRPDPALCSNAS